MSDNQVPTENDNVAVNEAIIVNLETQVEAGSDDAIADTAAAGEEAVTQEAAPEKKGDELSLCANGEIVWNETVIAQLLPSQPLLSPKFELIGEELKQEATATVVSERLYSWLDEQVRAELFPLAKLKAAIDFIAPPITEELPPEEVTIVETPIENSEEASTSETPAKASQTKPAPKMPLSDAARSIAIKIYDLNGILLRDEVHDEVQALSQDNRRELRNLGVKFGRSAIYLPLLLKPKAARLNAILTHFAANKTGAAFLPRMGVTSFNAEEGVEDDAYIISGFKNVAGRVIRLDILDRVLDTLFDTAKEAKGAIALPLAVVSLLGVSNDVASNVAEGLGWEKQSDEEGNVKYAFKRRKPAPRPQYRNENNANSNTAGANKERNFDKKFENAKRPQQQQGFGKKRKDKEGPKPKRNNDYISRESRDVSDSPFAILAKLKGNME